MGSSKYRNGFTLTLHEDVLEVPLRWTKPRMIFVNSMSDLFHKGVADEFILRTFEVMREAHWHTFQILTKRPERVVTLNDRLPWSSNIWMGVSVENSDYAYRAGLLGATSAQIKFLSLEPLLGPLPGLQLEHIDWAIVGGESGPGARPIDPDWVREIRDQCVTAEVAFFFKQWGGVQKHRNGRLLDGRTWDEKPQVAPPRVVESHPMHGR
jgi:protein gp37